MEDLLLYFLPGIILLGLITSIEDIKFGKIRNKWVGIALIYALIVHVGIILSVFVDVGINMEYIGQLLGNILIATIVGFMFWHFKLWTAGDGKLFIAFAALLPLSVYHYGYISFFPSGVLIINIFMPGLIFLIPYMIMKIGFKLFKDTVKNFLIEFFSYKGLIQNVISLFAIHYVIGLIASILNIREAIFLKILLSLTIYYIIDISLGERALYFMVPVSVLRLIFDKNIFSLQFVYNFLIILLVWRLLRGFLRGSFSVFARDVYSKTVKVNNLIPGMILSDGIEKRKTISERNKKVLNRLNAQIIKKGECFYVKKPKYSIKNEFIKEESEGVTKKQIDAIKKIGFKEVRVSESMPFAPFIFAGVIITMVVRGNILILVRNLF